MTDLARLSSEEITSRYIDAILQGDTMDTEDIVLDEAQGAERGQGVSGGAVLALLPKLMEILAAIQSGLTSVPAFTVRLLGQRFQIGPIPIKKL